MEERKTTLVKADLPKGTHCPRCRSLRVVADFEHDGSYIGQSCLSCNWNNWPKWTPSTEETLGGLRY